MAMKQKRTDVSAVAADAEKPDDSAPMRQVHMLALRLQGPSAVRHAHAAAPFRNKEKVLATCSCHITYRRGVSIFQSVVRDSIRLRLQTWLPSRGTGNTI